MVASVQSTARAPSPPLLCLLHFGHSSEAVRSRTSVAGFSSTGVVRKYCVQLRQGTANTRDAAGAGIERLHPDWRDRNASAPHPTRSVTTRTTIERALSTRGGCHTRSTEPLQKGRTEFLRTTGIDDQMVLAGQLPRTATC